MANTNITIKEVAARAGVSITTVSRVINNKTDSIAASTEQKVLKAIDDLDYSPNKSARALRHQKTEVIGVITPDISNPFFAKLIRGVEHEAYDRGYNTIICDTENDKKKEISYLDTLIQERVEGVIFIPTTSKLNKIYELIRAGIKVIFADRALENINASVVKADNLGGSYKLTSNLLAAGHRKIAFIKGPKGLTTTEERYQGYRKALEENSIPVNNTLINEGEFSLEAGKEAIEKILNYSMPDVVIGSNDLIAIGAMLKLQDMGYDIPEDIGVVGFDNIDLASFVVPGLTTVNIPSYDIGKKAFQVLIEMADETTTEDEYEDEILLKTEIIKRGSCKAI